MSCGSLGSKGELWPPLFAVERSAGCGRISNPATRGSGSTTPGGASWTLPTRPMITLLGQILQQAVDYDRIDRNPVRVGGRSARFLKRTRPKRTFLEVDEFRSLLDAAGQVEAEARRERQGLGRRAMLATLGLAGLRISELMDLKVAQVDLTRGRFKLADAKTEAGVREVEITLYLRDELLDYAMDRRARGLPLGPSDHFFGTVTGKRRDPDRFRDPILARAAARA